MNDTIEGRITRAEPEERKPLGTLAARLGASAAPGRFAGSSKDTFVHGVTHDSRLVRPGMLFVAIQGEHADGHAFVGRAAAAGAPAAIVEHEVEAPIPQLVVAGSRRALATAAAWWYGDPSAELGVVGITGTDGKTTTSFLALAALEAAGIPSGMLGTAALEIGSLREPNPEHATTPEAPRLQATLRAMAQAGDRAAILETTSHGLALERVAEVRYDIAILTNVTHEHLDLHGTFEAYRAAKLSLFERLATGRLNPPKAVPGWPRTGIVNADDPSATLFVETTRAAGARALTYGAAAHADVRLVSVEDDERQLRFRYRAAGRSRDAQLRLAGRFNIHNALAVIALGEALGLDPAAVHAGLASVERIPGRMERVVAGQPFDVVVDFAHSPASLEIVLDELGRSATTRGGGGLIAVFGSAGERDTAKRPQMGRIAGERCRLVVVTDEDPRAEDREAILAEIAAGAEAAGRHRGVDLLLIADRRAAIRTAFGRARRGDVVLLAGKGHEQTIEYSDRAEPWDEGAEALAALAELGYASEGTV